MREADLISLCVRWYLRYLTRLSKSRRDDALNVACFDHTTPCIAVQHSTSELEKRCRPYLKATNDSWRVDESLVKKAWMYLFRALDSKGNTLEFLLSCTSDAKAATCFFSNTLAAPHPSTPRALFVRNVNSNAARALRNSRWKGSVHFPSVRNGCLSTSIA